jgi:hypothetical protein
MFRDSCAGTLPDDPWGEGRNPNAVSDGIISFWGGIGEFCFFLQLRCATQTIDKKRFVVCKK